jgi:ubiquitin-protein ligase E3 C
LKKHAGVASFVSVDERKYIDEFFGFLTTLTQEEKESFLKFATGLSRAPMLGFKSLYPPFVVYKLRLNDPGEFRLCSSSTCANMFKLPYFGISQLGIEKMKKSVIESINANAGFDLA